MALDCSPESLSTGKHLVKQDNYCRQHFEGPMETLYTKLGIQEVAVALRTKCLRRYGHIVPASSLDKFNNRYRYPWP